MSKVRLSLYHVKKNLYGWIQSQIQEGLIDIPSSQVVWREQSEPLPARPCVTLKIISGPRRVGFDDHVSLVDDPSGTFNLGGQRELTLSVQVFGTKAQPGLADEIANLLNASLSKMTVTDRLRAGILEGGVRKGVVAVFSRGDVSDFSALEETEFEERSQFDVILGVAENIEDQAGIIETAVVNVTKNP